MHSGGPGVHPAPQRLPYHWVSALSIPQPASAKADLRHGVEERVVDRLAALGVGERPTLVLAAPAHAHVGIFAVSDPPVHLLDTPLHLLLECGELLADRLAQAGQVEGGQDALLLTPLLVAEQVVREAAKLHTGATHDIAGLQPVADLLVDQELIAVGVEPFRPIGVFVIEVALEADGDPGAFCKNPQHDATEAFVEDRGGPVGDHPCRSSAADHSGWARNYFPVRCAISRDAL